MSHHVIVGAGPVGTAAARQLADKGERVRLLTRSGSGPDHDLIQRVAGDANDPEALARHTEGRTAPELADDLYGDRSRVVTVRAEVSRLRKQFAGMLAAQPYRFAGAVEASVAYPDDMSMLLPSSTAPAVQMARRHHQQQGSQR